MKMAICLKKIVVILTLCIILFLTSCDISTTINEKKDQNQQPTIIWENRSFDQVFRPFIIIEGINLFIVNSSSHHSIMSYLNTLESIEGEASSFLSDDGNSPYMNPGMVSLYIERNSAGIIAYVYYTEFNSNFYELSCTALNFSYSDLKSVV